MKKFALIPAAAIFALPFALFAQAPTSSTEVATLLAGAGYTEVREIERDDGLWEVDVRRADGRWGEIHVDPASGEILDAESGRAMLDAAAVLGLLQGQVYQGIEDLSRDGATWEVEATDQTGQRVELRLSAFDGRVLYRELED